MRALATCAMCEDCVCETIAEKAGCNMRRVRDLPTVERDSILDVAGQITHEDRRDVYAHPSVNFDRIARLWSVILGVEVTPEQHALCMIAVKISRLVETPGHRDSLIDIAGYARTIELLGEGVN